MVIGPFAEKPDRVECQRLCVFTPICNRLSHRLKDAYNERKWSIFCFKSTRFLIGSFLVGILAKGPF